MPKLIPKLRETPKGLLSYDLGADSVLIFPIAQMLEEKFGLDAKKLPIFGLDSIFLDMVSSTNLHITIAWDIWSDLFIMALEKKANDLIKEIAEYLDSKLEELEELETQLKKKDSTNNESNDEN